MFMWGHYAVQGWAFTKLKFWAWRQAVCTGTRSPWIMQLQQQTDGWRFKFIYAQNILPILVIQTKLGFVIGCIHLQSKPHIVYIDTVISQIHHSTFTKQIILSVLQTTICLMICAAQVHKKCPIYCFIPYTTPHPTFYWYPWSLVHWQFVHCLLPINFITSIVPILVLTVVSPTCFGLYPGRTRVSQRTLQSCFGQLVQCKVTPC